MDVSNNCILYLMGFAGTGKLTIARALADRAAFIIVDNHFINNVVFKLIPRDRNAPPGTWGLVRRVRDVVIDTIRDLSSPHDSFIFTNEVVEGSAEDASIFAQIQQLAKDRQAHFLPVRLLISADEIARRVVSPERAEQLKSVDAAEARSAVLRRQVYVPRDVGYFDIDVTTLAASRVADLIIREARSRFACET